MPLQFAWGEAFQFDWSEEGIVIGGVYRRVQMAHLTLCASRAFWLVAYPGQLHEMLFDAHWHSVLAEQRRIAPGESLLWRECCLAPLLVAVN